MSIEEAIKLELSILETKVENDGELLPFDYADQYIAWRPVTSITEVAQSETPAQQGQGSTQPAQTEGKQTGTTGLQGNIQQPSEGQSTSTQQPSVPSSQSSDKPSSGGLDIYGGFNTYEEYIADLQQKLPQFSKEELKERFPDQATGYVDQDLVNQDIKDGRLHGPN